MILRPTRSTLFPYTTLFRSKQSYRFEIFTYFAIYCLHEMKIFSSIKSNDCASFILKNTSKVCLSIIFQCHALNLDCLDRKSTRLNSSHQIISYAVSCLKKNSAVRRHRKAPKAWCCATTTCGLNPTGGNQPV